MSNPYRTTGFKMTTLYCKNNFEFLKLKEGPNIIKIVDNPMEYEKWVQFGNEPGTMVTRFQVPVYVKGEANFLKKPKILDFGKAICWEISQIKSRNPKATVFKIIVNKKAGPKGYYKVEKVD